MIIRKNIKNEKGITLIVLVITVAIMMIIAGATINVVVGEGGILEQVKETEDVRNKQIEQSDKETNKLIDQADEEMKNVWKDSSKANPPKLSEEMVPVKWDETKKAWIVTNNKDSEWFDYSKKKWANVMLRDGLKVEGITNASTEKLAKMNGKKVTEVGSMFVWIPRYAYQIESGYHSSTAGKINIEFMVGTTNMSVKGRTNWDNQSGEGNWNIHPAFEYDKTVEGIWVAKFEASHTGCTRDISTGQTNTNRTDLTLQVKPNVTSWRSITIGNMFEVCLNYKEELNSHMMKNTEWGAVAYLTRSIYGKNAELYKNPNSNYITGQAGETVNSDQTSETYSYETSKGIEASTTGNVYGIYDMSGGSWDIVAAYLNNGHSNLSNGGNLVNETLKYRKDVYNSVTSTGENTREQDYENAKLKYGDAIYETSNTCNIELKNGGAWEECYVIFCSDNMPFLARGGGSLYGGVAAIFAFSPSYGMESSQDSFRPVLTVF